jgi:hypothetical protein
MADSKKGAAPAPRSGTKQSISEKVRLRETVRVVKK